MAQYRIYLSDEANFVQKAVGCDYPTDDDAVAYARTLIKAGGRVEIWTEDTLITPLLGSISHKPGPLSAALLRRSCKPVVDLGVAS